MKSIALPDTNTQPLKDAVQRDPNCTQPCWHGITVGQTTPDEALSALQANQAYFSSVTLDDRNDRIYAGIPSAQISAELIRFSDKNGKMVIRQINIDARNQISGLTLADAIDLFGTPLWSQLKLCGAGEIRYIVATVGFRWNIEVLTGTLYRNGSQYPEPSYIHIMPATSLDRVTYRSSDMKDSMPKWIGFRSWRRDEIPHAALGICEL